MTACADRPGYLPRFQPQNPAISGDDNGWVNCTAYSGAMAAAYDTCGGVNLTGEMVRSLSSEPRPSPGSPGLNLRQLDDALNRYGVDLEVRYRLPWADFARKINKGEGGVLQLETGPFLNTKFKSTAGAVNHAVFVPPGWGVMDPAADGRRNLYWEYDGTPYPQELLKRAAGRLILSTNRDGSKNRLDYGYVYAAFTRDRRSTWTWQHGPGKFVLWRANDATRECTAIKTQVTGGTKRHACTPPRLYRTPDGRTKLLVRMLAGAYKDKYVPAAYSEEVP